MAFQPFQNDLGKRAYEEICGSLLGRVAQDAAATASTTTRLNLREPKAKEFLFRNMEQFLFKAGQVGT